MRLVLACLFLFLAPAGALLVTDRRISDVEGEFQKDAQKQTERLNSILQFNPARVRRIAIAPLILQLKEFKTGSAVAARACGSPDVYRRLFDGLTARCGSWTVLRRARWAALLSVVGTAFVFALILMARITVQRYATLEVWPGNWTMWFVMRGVMLLLIAQVAGALSGYGIVLQTVTGKVWITLAALMAPFAAMVWIERKLVFAFVEPQRLRMFRPRGVLHADETPAEAAQSPAPAPAAAPKPAAPDPPAMPARAGIGLARRRRRE
jgi:hypothetical protein